MGMIKELYDFVSDKELEMHAYSHDGRYRIIILWPNGCNHNGSKMNLEVCEADSEDRDKAVKEAFTQAVSRYTELKNRLEKKHESGLRDKS